MVAQIVGNSVQSRENSSDKQKVFNPEDSLKLIYRTVRHFALGKAGEDDQNYEDNIGKTPMGANGLQKVEDLNGEEGISPNNINPGMKESSELGPVNS